MDGPAFCETCPARSTCREELVSFASRSVGYEIVNQFTGNVLDRGTEGHFGVLKDANFGTSSVLFIPERYGSTEEGRVALKNELFGRVGNCESPTTERRRLILKSEVCPAVGHLVTDNSFAINQIRRTLG